MPLRLLLALLAAALLASLQPAAAQVPAAPVAASLAPSNPAAARAAVTLRVERAGVQRVTAASLRAAGLDIAAMDTSRLWLRLRGEPVAIELGDDGLRFFAPAPGNRWNAADVYWLTLEDAPGPRIADAAPASEAPPRATAAERGAARSASRYDSLAPGPDGDHWFMADLRAGPDLPPATLTAPLTETLPPATGPLTVTVAGTAYVGGTHRLQVRAGAAESTVTWSGAGDWAQTVTLAASAPSVTLTLLASRPDGVLVDSVAWERSVTLDAAGNGAFFVAAPGAHRYQITGMPLGAALYDVADPRAPLRVALDAGQFSTDGGADGRALVLAGPGTLHEPPAAAHAPLDIAAPRDADVLYIGPASLHGALGPLLALRRTQGYAPLAVDVQALYDAWSYGQVDPEAIRSFLRYAAATWPRRPAAVTLVGDGTSDPLDRTRRGPNNLNLVPPYLAMVDPWLGETACEGCYANLDGADPRADPLPDLLIGRLPVKSADELGALVSKLVAYETAPPDQEWARRQVFIADNHREADGAVDRAGDFAAAAEEIAALAPPGVTTERVYYDPTAPVDVGEGRVPDADAAREQAFAALDAGAGVVTFVGHGSNFQWATTQIGIERPYLLSLYDPDRLTNRDRLPVVLSMTCLSGAFQTPAFSGTSLDERMLLNPGGGAVAVWAPTGFGVLHGHDAMMRGFFRAMSAGAAPPPGVRDWRAVGALVLAGYRETSATAPCCDDALLTFALLGDPLTPLRAAERRVVLPVTGR